ncbi:MAG: CHAD domain-containing protein [Anaerolineales bacterium]|nr:CHAD domain-containing protein [Anaerolineales bacterium]
MEKIETEAKFVIPDSSTFAALQKLTHLGDFELKSIGVKAAVDRYLDTADKRLYQAGWACRLRSIAAKQLLTLKSLTPAQDKLHRRRELEIEVEPAQAQGEQWQTWPDSPAKELVGQIAGSVPLQILFTLYQTRHQFHVLKHDQALMELSLDEVSLNDTHRVNYRELEAELIKSGDEADLGLLVEALQARWPLPVELRSKFERAWAEVIAPASGDEQSDQPISDKLTELEKSLLKRIAAGPSDRLSKRAMIVLMLASNISVANIAREVGLTPRTIRRWQKKFAQKRLNIFPAAALNGEQASAEPEMATVAESEPEEPAQMVATSPKKKKAKKESNLPAEWPQDTALIEYPLRDRIGLEPSDSLAEAGRKVLGFYFAQMLAHEPGTRLGQDIEAVHDMRVATRRMRAAFRVFEAGLRKKATRPLLDGLRAAGRNLGRVRDLDVLLEKLDRYQAALPESDPAGLQPLREMWLMQRKQARQELLAYLDSKKYRQFKQDFLKFVTSPGLGAKAIPTDKPVPYQLRHLVQCLIYKRFEAVQAYDRVLGEASLETLHQLRISFKQFRYALEYFAEILGKEGRRVIGEVKILQDHLGELNDAKVAAEMLSELLADWVKSRPDQPQVEQLSPAPIAAYLQAKLEERQHLLETFPQTWARFNRPELRRDLALAISVL